MHGVMPVLILPFPGWLLTFCEILLPNFGCIEPFVHEAHVEELPLWEHIQIETGLVFLVTNERDLGSHVLYDVDDALVDGGEPVRIVVRLVAHSQDVDAFVVGVVEAPADHLLALLGRPGVRDGGSRAVGTADDDDILRLVQAALDDTDVCTMRRLNTRDEYRVLVIPHGKRSSRYG